MDTTAAAEFNDCGYFRYHALRRLRGAKIARIYARVGYVFAKGNCVEDVTNKGYRGVLSRLGNVLLHARLHVLLKVGENADIAIHNRSSRLLGSISVIDMGKLVSKL